MKKHFLTLFILLFTWTAYSQNLSMAQVESLRKMSIAEAEKFLDAHQWKLIERTMEADAEVLFMSFGYDLNGNSKNAKSFLSLYPMSRKIEIVSITTLEENKYQGYLNEITNEAAKLIDTYTDQNKISVKVYQNASMTYIVSNIQDERNHPPVKLYEFTIMATEDYNQFFKR